ncbi:MAG: UDP-N-acetylmuramoyl-L-alanyl-D-glutamate--2,6-diaminopimelate ligase [Armatimonadetes bacterium]|nr:UDP-N-acetylmuramoyl-L-alanyl-D-glutamate--2,6-diaminopimelate ligase [Armatimonadota bacterium]
MTLEEVATLLGVAFPASACRLRLGRAVHDSREARPGDLFVCIEGDRFDGHRFAADAAARGAVALVARLGMSAQLPQMPVLGVRDTRKELPVVSAALCGYPSRGLALAGVTGTKGKTSTVRMLAAILRSAGRSAATIGTLGADLNGDPLESAHTTPEADQLQSLFAQIRDAGGQAVAMEVSSHSICKHRVDCCDWDVLVFTNLSQDHLDFHNTMDEYFAAKALLFSDLAKHASRPPVSVINADDARADELARLCVGRVIRFGEATDADPRITDVRLGPAITDLTLTSGAVSERIALPLAGRFQVHNAAAAVAAAMALGVSLEAAAEALRHVGPVPGRFQTVPTGRAWHAVVDYAHSPGSVEQFLQSARALTSGRLVAVFGCGGDRDKTKRPIMLEIARRIADQVVVTSDNPRTEKPEAIIADILARRGEAGAPILVEPDRRAAIGLALAGARDGDLVAVYGKGHEDYQEIDGVKHPFDDRLVIQDWLEANP